MEVNLFNKEQAKNMNLIVSHPIVSQSTFMQSYSYNKSTDKFNLFKNKLQTQNYFEEDNDVNVIHPSTK
jgi:hypothetical protein